ncbi:CDN_1a_G0015470.mRNA.1.CDS.1 [Saccharomyces cerevisiae]|nr:CDN_1a_G0015470.mRNA.1.CDS.1 [Saccharomyces cerevisiae]CAI4526873.1 ABH_G0015320.mRNA.1.CDS.1 [Saccharomyces cerevisiae]CAI6715706.1 ABH_G0015320.mRNA.1.CDS.1 [Saccharomyces cerevisiae]CAI7263933.1 CDN_1a_G0015470.mRNA.1.CDS.1 [Saccharomyces cerevisiae]
MWAGKGKKLETGLLSNSHRSHGSSFALSPGRKTVVVIARSAQLRTVNVNMEQMR